jgi:RNA polymerase sigma-70 factor, ECF subfamily
VIQYVSTGFPGLSDPVLGLLSTSVLELSPVRCVRSMVSTIKPADATSCSRPARRTDEELLLEYRERGSRDAFSELVHRYERELYSYLRRYLGDERLAEDTFQATFLQLHLKCHQFEAGRRVRPWLYTIATNQAIDAQRKNKRHRMASLDRANGSQEKDASKSLLELLASKELEPGPQLEADERRDWIRQAVSQLPEQLQSAITLVYYQGLKYREAADVLGIPVGTVKSRLHAAIFKLNEAWNRSHMSENG